MSRKETVPISTVLRGPPIFCPAAGASGRCDQTVGVSRADWPPKAVLRGTTPRLGWARVAPAVVIVDSSCALSLPWDIGPRVGTEAVRHAALPGSPPVAHPPISAVAPCHDSRSSQAARSAALSAARCTSSSSRYRARARAEASSAAPPGPGAQFPGGPWCGPAGL